jgi:hypothetical protein
MSETLGHYDWWLAEDDEREDEPDDDCYDPYDAWLDDYLESRYGEE